MPMHVSMEADTRDLELASDGVEGCARNPRRLNARPIRVHANAAGRTFFAFEFGSGCHGLGLRFGEMPLRCTRWPSGPLRVVVERLGGRQDPVKAPDPRCQ